MKVVMCWSGGKDSAMALHEARRMRGVEVVGLLTTINAEFDRISMHGVRRTLLDAQAAALRLPVEVVALATPAKDARCPADDNAAGLPTDDAYSAAMRAAIARLQGQGVEGFVFGDLFLADIRAYREALLAPTGMPALFPLWGRDTTDLARQVIELGFEAHTTCIDGTKLAERHVGRLLDRTFLDDLPAGVDPCGENGEYHSFVANGPGFAHRVPIRLGERVHRPPFWFCDLLPAEDEQAAA
jgi:uncharacterized protein (TIGR00290 family)